jgi:hypothetical protein
MLGESSLAEKYTGGGFFSRPARPGIAVPRNPAQGRRTGKISRKRHRRGPLFIVLPKSGLRATAFLPLPFSWAVARNIPDDVLAVSEAVQSHAPTIKALLPTIWTLFAHKNALFRHRGKTLLSFRRFSDWHETGNTLDTDNRKGSPYSSPRATRDKPAPSAPRRA